MNIKVLMILGIALCFASTASALEGVATFYSAPYVPSACYGYEEIEYGDMLAAAGKALWRNGEACGEIYEVECIGALRPSAPQPCNNGSSVVGRIVDRCPLCPGPINLSEEAFEIIANVDEGVIKIDYRQF